MIITERFFYRRKYAMYELNDLEAGEPYGIQLQALSPSNRESIYTKMIFGTPVTSGKASTYTRQNKFRVICILRLLL